MRGLALALVVVTGAAEAVAAPQVVAVTTATSDVRDVLVDGDARLLATSGGIVIDRAGRRTLLTSRDGLPGVRFISLSKTAAGVWAGGVDGLALLRRTGEHYRVAETLALRRARRVIDAHGATWFATFGTGLHRRGAEANAPLQRIPIGRYRKRITDLLATRTGLWVASAGTGLVRISPTGRLTAIRDARSGLASELVWRLMATGRDIIAATSAGLSVLRGGQVVREHQLTTAIASLAIRDVRALARHNGAWIAGTYGGGVYRLRGHAARRIAGAITRVHALAASGHDLLIAHDRGATRVTGSRVHQLIAGGLHNPDVTALARAFGKIWIGTFAAGLATMQSSGAITPVTIATRRWRINQRINDLAVTGAGSQQRLWIATDRGLWSHDGRRFVPVMASDGPGRVPVTSLHVDRRGALWLTTARAVLRLHDGIWKAYLGDAQVPQLQAQAVTTDAAGYAWIGTLSGLLRLDPATGKLRHFNSASGDTAVDWVTAVVPWGQRVVAGTYHGGLSWPAARGFAVERRSATGLPAGWVNPHAMRVIDGTLWFGALDRGLVIGRRGSWQRLTIAHGLPGNDVTAILPLDSMTVLIGTRAGLARISK